MLKRLCLIGAALLIFYPGVGRAADGGYRISSAPPVCAFLKPYGDVCLHGFGGRETLIPLTNTKGFSCDEIMVQLFQLAPKSETEIGKLKILEGDRCGYVSLFLPAVTERTVFRVLFSVANSQGARYRENPVVSEQLVAVYPEGILAPLKDIDNLVVIDPLGKLKPFLDRENVKYSTTMTGIHSASPICLWVPVTEDKGEFPFGCSTTLVLHEKTPDLPAIKTSTEDGRARIDIYMPLLSALPDNPLVQKTFVELIMAATRGP